MAGPTSTSLRVNVYAPNNSLIKELKSHLEAVNARISGIKGSKTPYFTDPDYAISFGVGRHTSKALKIASRKGVKLVMILPVVVDREKDYKSFLKFVNKIPKNISFKVIWVGDNGESFKGNFNQDLKEYFLISSHDAARIINKAMFSFWGNSEEISVTDKIPANALSKYHNPKSKKKVFQGQIRGRILTPGTDTISRIFINPVVDPVIVKQKPIKRRSKKLIALLVVLVLILLIPVILLMFSGVLGFLGYQNLNNNPHQAERLFARAENLAKFTSSILPIKPAILMHQTASVGHTSAEVIILTKQIKDGILGKEDFDLTLLANKLKLDLDRVYTDSAFLETEVGENNFFDRAIIASALELIPQLPEILGVDKPKTYLVLIQDNAQIKPTGGKLTDVVLLTFQNGKVVNTEEVSVESVDSLLKGQISPPAPIRNYLGQSNWKLADANWDPGFSQTSERAMWFLDKSLDEQVDGVIGVIGKDRWERLKNLEIDITDLKNKNIQIYLTNPETQSLISKLNWSGEVAPQQGVWLGVVEANMSGHDVSVARENDLKVELDGSTAKYTLTLTLSPDKEYKSYLRVLTLPGTSFSQVQVLNQGKVVKTVAPEINGNQTSLEAGVLVDIPQGQSRNVVFSFTQPLKLTSSNVPLYWRSQAGIGKIPTNIALYLTNGREFSYNTNLENDFFEIIKHDSN